MKSYFVIKDGDRTAWFVTEHIQNVMDAVGVLDKVYQIPGAEENIDNLLIHMPSMFRPVEEDNVRADTHDLQAPPSDGGILAVVDMKQENLRTMNWISARDGICAVSGDLFRFLGVYEIALRDGINGVPNENTFAEKLYHHCFIRRLPMPEETEESFTMTMGGM